MNIQNIEFKNFNSYGEDLVKLDFSNQNSMVCLIGASGNGKSTIREVISYALYGKITDKKLSDLPNRINKKLWVKIKVVCANNLIVIERGLMPNLFSITINGEVLDTNGKLNAQDILETEYLKMPQSTFDNIISISIDRFKSFLTMSPRDKRLIIDQIFGISFFNEINDKLKEKNKEINNEISNLTNQITLLDNSKKNIESKINESINKKNELLSIQLNVVNEQLGNLNIELQNLNSEMNILDNKYNEIAKMHKELLNKEQTHKSIIYSINDKLKLYNADKCPECQSSLQSQFHFNLKEKLTNDKLEAQKQIDSIAISLEKINNANKLILEKKKGLNSKLIEIKSSIISYNKQLESTKTEKNEDFTYLLTDISNKVENLIGLISENKSESYLYTELSFLFSDDGIKKQITKNFLPSFNAECNTFCKKLHFPYKIQIDDKFDTTILSATDEISVKTLSTGEKKRSDLAVLMALLKIIKVSYNVNILFLDELLSGLDPNNISEVINIIKFISKDLNLNVIITSHTELQNTDFDSIWSVSKPNIFSEISIN